MPNLAQNNESQTARENEEWEAACAEQRSREREKAEEEAGENARKKRERERAIDRRHQAMVQMKEKDIGVLALGEEWEQESVTQMRQWSSKPRQDLLWLGSNL